MKKLLLLAILLMGLLSAMAQENLLGEDIREAKIEMMNDTTYWLPIITEENGFVSFRSEFLMINENPVHSLALFYDKQSKKVNLIKYVVTGKNNVERQISALDKALTRVSGEKLVWKGKRYLWKITTGKTGFGMETAWMDVTKL